MPAQTSVSMPPPARTTRRMALASAAFTALVASLLLAMPTAASAAAAGIAVDAMTTNGRVDPLGIPGDAPSFGWAGTATARNVVQSAYEIRVGSQPGDDDVWSSGKVASDEQVDIVFGGAALEPATRYFWQVRVWDGDDEASAWSETAWFETGLLQASDWGDAAWIGKAESGELARWTDYTADFEFSIDDHAFGAFLRAPALNNALMWQVSVADGVPSLRPHTRIDGSFALLENVDLSEFTSVDELLDGSNELSVTVSTGDAEGETVVVTELNGDEVDARTVEGTENLPAGYVGFRANTHDSTPENFTVHAVTVTAADDEVLLDTDFSEGNPFAGGRVEDGNLVVEGPSAEFLLQTADDHAPHLRTEFATEAGKTIDSARVYASAHGIYELEINGQKVGDHVLAPGFTDYDYRILSQTYDVTDLVTRGENAFGGTVGDGWWAGNVGMSGRNLYGSDVDLIARMKITYTDGTAQWVDTDETWTWAPSPVVFNDLQDGEIYDANFERPGWSMAGFEAADWTPVTTNAYTPGSDPIYDRLRPRPATELDRLHPQPDEPIREVGVLDTVTMTEPDPGVRIYDLGQNMVGVPRVTITGQAGETVRLRHGEELYRIGPDTDRLYTANLRAADATDYYTFAEDGTITYEPTFTQHGFRYIEITGLDELPAAGDVQGVVWTSDSPVNGTLETSSDLLNQLQSNIEWGARGNFLSIPTDTPARDERLGWTGDINVFAPASAYIFDTRGFLGKWMDDVRDSQHESGGIPAVVPNSKNMFPQQGIGWEDAVITVPHGVWNAYGDTKIVRDNWEAMTAFADYTRASAAPDNLEPGRTDFFTHDWLHLDDPTNQGVLGTAIHAQNIRMMAEMAAAIGEDAEAAEYAALFEDIRQAFTDAYVAEDGTVLGHSQTGYALALGKELINDPELQKLAGERYVEKLAATDNHLRTGFIGTPWLLPALSAIDRDDIAYEMLLKETYPSWGYPISQWDATTMWERWNSINPDGQFDNVGMNSFNHFAYGAVGDWMYRNVGGLQPLEPGYKVSRIAPVTTGPLDHASGSFDTAYGLLSSQWRSAEGGLELEVTVPVNTTSEVVIPVTSPWMITESGTALEDAEGVLDVAVEGDHVVVTVGSGSYSFVTHDDLAELADILDAIDAIEDRVGEHAAAGDLNASQRERLEADLDAAAQRVIAAMAAGIEGDAATVAEQLTEAHGLVSGLRAWLEESTVDPPVAADLGTRLEALERLLGGAAAWVHGLGIAVVPLTEPVQPGQRITGVVQVTNAGEAPLTGVSAEVTAGSWSVDDSTAVQAEIAPGADAQLEFSALVPAKQGPGEVAASVELTFSVGDESFVAVVDGPWAVVGSPVSITDVRSEHEPAGGDRAELSVTVENSGDREIRGQVFAEAPDGWTPLVPSSEVIVPAGDAVEVTLPVIVPWSQIDGTAVTIPVSFRSQGVRLAEASGQVSVQVPEPAAGEFSDHVDFGEADSEEAHAVQGSPSSGTSTEAGYTRRYAHSQYPGSWFSAEVEVPAGEAFAVRLRETYEAARTKMYNVYVDDVLVDVRIVPRTESGEGTVMHQLVVDDPEVLDHDGSVRIRFEFPEDASGFYDPSIADLWVLPLGEDVTPPIVGAVPDSSAAPGANGWSRGPVNVSVVANDDRDSDPRVQYGTGSGWTDYTGPVEISGDGVHDFHYRASDAAGNSSGTQTLAVRIDGTAPVTDVELVGSPGELRVELTADDALSGVAQTWFRVDAGPWESTTDGSASIETSGQARVEYYSVDVAGNAEPVRVVSVSDLPEPGAPRVTEHPRSWSVVVGADVTFTAAADGSPEPSVQWQARADGSGDWVDVEGATEASFTLRDVALEDSGTQVRAVFTNNAGEAATNAAVLQVRDDDGGGGIELPVVEPVDESELTDANRGPVRVPDEAFAGERIEVSVGSDQAGEAISVWFYSEPVDLGWQVVDTDGTVSVTVPADAELGEHRVVVYDDEAELFGWDAITIVEPDGGDGGGSDGSGGGSGDSNGDGAAGSGGFIPGVGNTASQALLYTALLLLMLGGAVLWLRRGLHIR